MRLGLLAAALAVVSGCGLTGDDEDAVRLLLYASPRVVPTDGEHISLIGAEAVDPGGTLDPNVPMCGRLSAQLGTFDAPASTGEQHLDADGDGDTDGGLGCPFPRCVFVSLPTGKLRREFAIYHSGLRAD